MPISEVVTLPERLGGAVVMDTGESLMLARSWLDTPFVRIAHGDGRHHHRVWAGMDRLYVRSGDATFAVDAHSGEPMALGPWPSTPFVADYVALDSRTALARTEARGLLLTTDGGHTWGAISTPHAAVAIGAGEGGFAVKLRVDSPPSYRLHTLTVDGRLLPEARGSGDTGLNKEQNVGASHGPYGSFPLLAAVEDGFPLTDGSALVARSGQLARIRLADGAVLERQVAAFGPMEGRCHPLKWPGPSDPSGIGFVCADVSGRTDLYRYHPKDRAVRMVRSFAEPRVVLSSRTGAVVVRGGCGTIGLASSRQTTFCVLGHDGRPREFHIQGAAEQDRFVVLEDGAVVVVTPPRADPDPAVSRASGRVAIIRDGRVRHAPITTTGEWSVLALGTWLDGVEERAPGILGGYIEVSGTLYGYRLDTEGTLTLGPPRGSAHTPLVCGPLGIVWPERSFGGGWLTQDGGMTWKETWLPQRTGRTQAPSCGPVGVSLGGWVRVGWDPSFRAAPMETKRLLRVHTAPPFVHATCTEVKPGAPKPKVGVTPPPRCTDPDDPSSCTETHWPPLFHQSAPEVGPSLARAWADLSSKGTEAYARLYAWGPKDTSGNWSIDARWQVMWQSLWLPWKHAASSLRTAPPFATWDETHAALNQAQSQEGLFVSQDGKELLLFAAPQQGLSRAVLARSQGSVASPPIPSDFPAITTAVFSEGRWIAAGPSPSSNSLGIWEVSGSGARPILSVPHTQTSMPRLVRRATGPGVALLYRGEGQMGGLAPPQYWLGELDLSRGTLGGMRSVGPVDFGGSALPLCSGTEAGWVIYAPIDTRGLWLSGRSRARGTALARVRLSLDFACVESIVLSGNWVPDKGGAPTTGAHAPQAGPSAHLTHLTEGQAVSFRCVEADRHAPPVPLVTSSESEGGDD